MLNVVCLMGRLTADPELKTTPSGISACTCTIAVDRSYVRPGEERKADFINLVLWRSTAEFVCKYFSKGSMIAVKGSLQSRSYEDRNGDKRTRYEVVVDAAHFAGSKADGGQAQGQSAAAQAPARPQEPKQQSMYGRSAPSYLPPDDFALVDDGEDFPF